MKTVILYGELAKRFGKHHRFAVRTAAEAIRALRANFPGFEKFLAESHLSNMGFKIFVGGRGLRHEKEIFHPSGKCEAIRLVPVVAGASGELRLFAGLVLIAAGAVLSFTPGAAASPYLIAAGASLTIGGVIQLLTSVPPSVSDSKEPDRKASYIFNGPQNTTVQGRAVPVGYGRLIVGSVVISAGIVAHEEV